jgi:predicted phage terminase large subunit-like protein
MAWPLIEPGTEFVPGWHVDEICEHLEAVYRGQIRRLLINVPPGCMKSLLTCVFWPVWAWIQPEKTGEPGAGFRWIYASFDASLTLRDANKALLIMQSAWFRERWGHLFTLPNDPAGADYTNSRAGFRFSTSVAGKMTGRHGDAVVYDDPHKPLETSETALAKALEWHRGTVPSRFRDLKTARRVCIMQRLHEADLSGVILEEGGWEHLCLPMTFEAARPCYTSVGGDPRTEEGELLWPARIGPEELAQLQKDLKTERAIAAQLQQRPTPEDGVIFKKGWFQTWRALPARFELVVISVDATFKDTDGTDFVCIQTWGARAGEFYLIDQVMERMAFGVTCEEILKARRAAIARGLFVNAILIEDKANGPAIVDTISKKVPGVIAVDPEGGKIARANAVSGFFEARNVFHPSPEVAPWIDAHQTSLTSFPVAKHDDDVDACSQALIYLNSKRNAFSDAMDKIKEMMAKGDRVL